MSKKPNKTEEVHMGGPLSDHAWWNGKKYIPFPEMSKTHLQKAKHHIQKMQLILYNRISRLYTIEEKLDDEAQKRGYELKDYPSEFHKKTRVAKESAKNDQRNPLDVKVIAEGQKYNVPTYRKTGDEIEQVGSLDVVMPNDNEGVMIDSLIAVAIAHIRISGKEELKDDLDEIDDHLAKALSLIRRNRHKPEETENTIEQERGV